MIRTLYDRRMVNREWMGQIFPFVFAELQTVCVLISIYTIRRTIRSEFISNLVFCGKSYG